MENLPNFKYHLNPIWTGAFNTDKSVHCECYGQIENRKNKKTLL